MSAQKYLLIYRNPVAQAAYQPSPEEMQQMYAQWAAWKEKFKTEILDLGDALKPGGKVLREGSTTDGPFIEAKEVMGGYSIIEAASWERAVEISRGCPVLFMPGASLEIRELVGM